MDIQALRLLVEDNLPDWRKYYDDVIEAALDLELIDEQDLPAKARELDFNDERANWKRASDWDREYHED